MVTQKLLNTEINKIQRGALPVTVICVINVDALESCIKCIYYKDVKISGNHGNHTVARSTDWLLKIILGEWLLYEAHLLLHHPVSLAILCYLSVFYFRGFPLKVLRSYQTANIIFWSFPVWNLPAPPPLASFLCSVVLSPRAVCAPPDSPPSDLQIFLPVPIPSLLLVATNFLLNLFFSLSFPPPAYHYPLTSLSLVFTLRSELMLCGADYTPGLSFTKFVVIKSHKDVFCF